MLDEEAWLVFQKPIFAVSQVKFAMGGKTKEPDSATGFFCGLDDKLYFITNRHNVIDEDDWFYPDELRLNLHTDQNDLTRNRMFTISLYDEDDNLYGLNTQKARTLM
jgi:hypothetical protein